MGAIVESSSSTGEVLQQTDRGHRLYTRKAHHSWTQIRSNQKYPKVNECRSGKNEVLIADHFLILLGADLYSVDDNHLGGNSID